MSSGYETRYKSQSKSPKGNIVSSKNNEEPELISPSKTVYSRKEERRTSETVYHGWIDQPEYERSEVEKGFQQKNLNCSMHQNDDTFQNASTDDSREVNFSHSSNESKPEKPRNQIDSKLSTFVVWFAVIAGLFLVPYIPKLFADNLNMTKPAEKNCTILLKFKDSYPGLDELSWKLLKVGVEHVQKDIPPQPTVFFILHHNQRKAKTFADNIATSIHGCLEAKDEPIILNENDLNTPENIEDYGSVISEYKPKLEQSNVMVVHDIQAVNGKVVEAFHTICDKETPMVPKSVIIFTYYTQTKPGSVTELYNFVEETLADLWKNEFSHRHNKIQPLITRMTENVLHLKS